MLNLPSCLLDNLLLTLRLAAFLLALHPLCNFKHVVQIYSVFVWLLLFLYCDIIQVDLLTLLEHIVKCMQNVRLSHSIELVVVAVNAVHVCSRPQHREVF